MVDKDQLSMMSIAELGLEEFAVVIQRVVGVKYDREGEYTYNTNNLTAGITQILDQRVAWVKDAHELECMSILPEQYTLEDWLLSFDPEYINYFKEENLI